VSGTEFGQQFINALSLGSIYALVAIGLAIVFSILRLINFAHGEVLMLGAFFTFYWAKTDIPFLLAGALGVASTILIGVLMERVAYRPVRNAPEVSLLLTSLGVSIAVRYIASLLFGEQPRKFPTPSDWEKRVGLVGDVKISITNIITVAVAFILLAALTWFVTRTQLGIAMRATAENQVAARLMGINVNTVIVTAFVIGSALAGVAGILWGARVGRIEPLMGFIPVLKAFVATVIGGFGSIPGAVVGAFILGFGEIYLVALLPDNLTGYRDAIIFGALIVILLVRPQGILGSTEPEKI
jgi:branched-chain amino acid transport system permease protein